MRRPAVVALVGLLLAPGLLTAAPLLDVLLAVVEGRTVAASDIALARALGVLGFSPSPSAITRQEIERFVDVVVILDEAGRIGIIAEPEQTERAWTAVVERLGGETAARALARGPGSGPGLGPPARRARGRLRAVLRGALRRVRVPGRGGDRSRARRRPARGGRARGRPRPSRP